MPRWTNEQLEAIESSGSNIIVSAGAGSGKTAVLTERVLSKVRSGISISELLILTFTNAAAHEMKERIRKALKKEGFLDQVNLIDSAYITTFDSYALSIVKKYHYMLGLSKKINIIDGTFIACKCEEFLEIILEEHYRERDEKFSKFITDFCVKDDKELISCIMTIYNKLTNKLNLDDYVNNYIDVHYSEDYFNKSFNEYMNLIKNKIELLKDLTEKISFEVDGDYYTKLITALTPLFNAKNYDEIKLYSNIRIPILKNSTDLGKKIKTDISALVKQISELTELDFEVLKSDYFSTKDYIEVILEIISKLHKRVMDYKKSINYYEFNDIALLAINILENNDNIRLEIKNNYKEIMIDEYQDTNDIQEYFISLISDNNVYMVGDIKQSIYRFRNANPDLFRSKYNNYQNGLGGKKIDLNKNFRSRKEILNDINVLFDLIMTDTIGGAEYKESHEMTFGNSVYEEEGKLPQNQDMEIFNYEHTNKNLTKDEVEAFIIGYDILEKINSGYKVFDKDSKVIRPCEYKDFVVLMDRTTSFDTYKKIFEYLGLPTTLLKDENIMEDTEISLIKNYLKMILKIDNSSFDKEFRYSFTSLARSYLYNMSDEEIYNCFSENSFYDTLLFKDAATIAKNINYVSAVDLLNQILDSTKFFDKILTTNKIDEKIMVIDYLKNIFNDLSDIGLSLQEICAYLDSIQENTKEIKVSKPVQEENSIKIMTIFKSKGLEFHICYLSGMSKQFNIRELNSLFFIDEKLGIIPSCFNEGISDTYLKAIAKNNYVLETISERIRLFYVALTRCKEKMIILCNIYDEDYENNIHDLVLDEVKLGYRSFNDIVKSIAGNLKGYVKKIDCENLKMSKDYLRIGIKDYKNLVEKDEVINIKNIEIKNEEVEEKHFSKEMHDLMDSNLRSNLDLGLKLHSVFENLDFNDINIDEMPISDYEKSFVRNFFNQDLLKNVKDAKVYQEYEFIYEDGKEIYHGIIDLMLIYDNKIDIIDYKLKNIDDTKYIKQLCGYKDFISKLFETDVNLYLYSISDNIIKKV